MGVLFNALMLNHNIFYQKPNQRITSQQLTDCLIQHLKNIFDASCNDRTELLIEDNEQKQEEQVINDENHEIKEDEDIKEDHANNMRTIIQSAGADLLRHVRWQHHNVDDGADDDDIKED